MIPNRRLSGITGRPVTGETGPMRAVAVLAGLLVLAPVCRADTVRLQWPLPAQAG